MSDGASGRMPKIPQAAQAALVTAARDDTPVKGLTHGYYKYPARFSPSFVRAAIEAFTQPTDLVLDNHVGGGTTLVEAMALGRHAIGIDISALAQFVATVKTTVFTRAELARMEAWASQIAQSVQVRKPSRPLHTYAKMGYYKHLSGPSRWRLRKAIEQALWSAARLETSRLESFARCIVLRTAQWALDGREHVPSLDAFRITLTEHANHMIAGAREFAWAVKRYAQRPTVLVQKRSAVGIEDDHNLLAMQPPRLIITSPPYPGVHVLYHRWQVGGGKEAPLPFMIANKVDGAVSSFYTMGDRKFPRLQTYFDNIRASMSSAVAVAGNDTTIVQMVAFSDPSWQLKCYLKVMKEIGLKEVFLPILENERDGRLWRSVPNRRWYSHRRGDTPGSNEVVLIHRKSELGLTRGRLQTIDRLCIRQVLESKRRKGKHKGCERAS